MEKKEAMKILKDFHDKSALFSVRTALDTVIPELKENKENEDERIKNEIIAFVEQAIHRGGGTPIPQEQEDRWIAWLEAQCKHTNFRNAIQVGDKVTRNRDGVLVNLSQLKRVAKKDEKQDKNNMGISKATKQKLEDNLHKALEKETPESCNEFLEKQGEQKPADKVEPKFKQE